MRIEDILTKRNNKLEVLKNFKSAFGFLKRKGLKHKKESYLFLKNEVC